MKTCFAVLETMSVKPSTPHKPLAPYAVWYLSPYGRTMCCKDEQCHILVNVTVFLVSRKSTEAVLYQDSFQQK